MIDLLTAPGLHDLPHGFAGRRGGVSEGVHAGLNVGLGSQDDRAAVLRNRELARDAVMPGAALVTVHQVHSPDVVTVNAAVPDAERPAADGMVTDRPGLLLGIFVYSNVVAVSQQWFGGAIFHFVWAQSTGIFCEYLRILPCKITKIARFPSKVSWGEFTYALIVTIKRS